MSPVKPLVIVDLQHAFQFSINERIIQATQTLIERAIEVRSRVVILEYYKGGKTLSCIQDMLINYRYKKVITKEVDGGGYLVSEYLYGRAVQQCVVCGVNTYACVYETIRELLQCGFTVDLAIDAVGDKLHRDKDGSMCQDGYYLNLRRQRKEKMRSGMVDYVRSTQEDVFIAKQDSRLIGAA